MISITREVAQEEFDKWLQKKKILKGTIEKNAEFVNTIVDAMCEGMLSIDGESKEPGKEATWKIKHKLAFPIGEAGTIAELEYLPRLNDKMLKPYLNGVKSDDSMGTMLGYVAALTRQPRLVLEQLDSVDKKIAMAIAIFFL